MERERKVLTQEFLPRTFLAVVVVGLFFSGAKRKSAGCRD
jgi:hypothetical protein